MILISLLPFPICSYIVLVVSFSSLSMISFSLLSIFKTVDLMSLTNISNVWASSGMVSNYCFFCELALHPCFLVCFVIC